MESDPALLTAVCESRCFGRGFMRITLGRETSYLRGLGFHLPSSFSRAAHHGNDVGAWKQFISLRCSKWELLHCCALGPPNSHTQRCPRNKEEQPTAQEARPPRCSIPFVQVQPPPPQRVHIMADKHADVSPTTEPTAAHSHHTQNVFHGRCPATQRCEWSTGRRREQRGRGGQEGRCHRKQRGLLTSSLSPQQPGPAGSRDAHAE